MGDVTTPQVDDVITALELVHYLYTHVHVEILFQSQVEIYSTVCSCYF